DGSQYKGDKLEGREQFTSKIIPSQDYKTVFGLIQKHENGDIFFAIVKEDTQSLRKTKLEGFESASEFAVTYSVGGGATIAYQKSEIVRLGNKQVITNPIFSRIAVYDLGEKSLRHYDCKPTLTGSEKVAKYTNEVNSMEEFEIEKTKIGEEVTFLPLMKD